MPRGARWHASPFRSGLGAVLVWWARELDVLSMGDESGAALGVDVDRATRRMFLVASWLAAATVAAAGLVGFVGLVVPNIARALGARGTAACCCSRRSAVRHCWLQPTCLRVRCGRRPTCRWVL